MPGRFLIDPVWWTFLFWLPDFFSKRYGVDLKHYGPPLVAIYVMADIGSVLGGWRSSRLLKRGFGLSRARKTGDAGLRASCALPVAGAMYAVQSLAGGGGDRAGLRRASGLFRQSLCPAVRYLPALGGRAPSSAWAGCPARWAAC